MTEDLSRPYVAPHRAEPSALNSAVSLLVVLTVYVVLSRSSYILQTSELRSTPWNPEAGLAVAAGALIGLKSIPVVFLGSILASLIWGHTQLSTWQVLWAAANALIFTGSAAILSDLLLSMRRTTTATAVKFLGFAVATTALSAFARIAITSLALGVSPQFLLPYTVALSVGNLTGILTVVPILMVWREWPDIRDYFGKWGKRQFTILVATILAIYVVFGLKSTDEFKFFYIIFLPVIAMALIDGFPGAAIIVLLTDILTLFILYLRGFEPSAAVELQVLMITLSATGLVLGATVSERERAVAELEDSHQHLSETQSALFQAARISLASEMATALAHDLNQPLTSTRNYIRAVRRTLSEKRLDRGQLIQFIDRAVAQIDSAAALIRSTRQFLEKGDVRRAKTNIRPIIDELVALTRAELSDARIRLTVSTDDFLPPAMANATQIQQVLLNLIKNAKESLVDSDTSGRHIELTVSSRNRPGFIEFSIVDNGPGVPEHVRPHLFSPIRSTKRDGLGLGLSLCKTIVTSHGGELWVSSINGKESCFSFTVPTIRLEA